MIIGKEVEQPTMPIGRPDKWLSVEDTAKKLKIHVNTLRQWQQKSAPEMGLYRGPIFHKVGRDYIYYAEDVRRWLRHMYTMADEPFKKMLEE